jgi:hypothetical protein
VVPYCPPQPSGTSPITNPNPCLSSFCCDWELPDFFQVTLCSLDFLCFWDLLYHDIAPSHLSFKFPSTDLQVILIPKMLLSSIALGAWFLLGPAIALTGSQTSFNFSTISVNPIDSSTCVAPGDYTTCLEIAVTTEQQCMSESTTVEGKNGCGCGGFIEQMNCFAGSCWNRVCYIRHLWELLLIFACRFMVVNIRALLPATSVSVKL